MFKPSGKSGGFASKIAHNSTLPSLAIGNKELRELQDLINAEKVALTSMQRLSNDFTKSSEALRAWGIGEGHDLSDILAHSCTMLAHVSHALNQLASHEIAIREHMKAVRTREERLDETKRRRKAVGSKADSAERKLNKMSPEHKNLQQQTDTLNGLRSEIRALDSEIMSEEARLSDFKRTTARTFMGLKFGGLLELGEKITIVGELGKLLIEEIPLDVTTPGHARTLYEGHEKTEKIVEDAAKCINEIVFVPPSVPEHPDNAYKYTPPATIPAGQPYGDGNIPTSPIGNFGVNPDGGADYGMRSDTLPVRIGDDGTRLTGSETNDFGRITGGGGHFATFPSNIARRQESTSLADDLASNPEFSHIAALSHDDSREPEVSSPHDAAPPYSGHGHHAANSNPWDPSTLSPGGANRHDKGESSELAYASDRKVRFGAVTDDEDDRDGTPTNGGSAHPTGSPQTAEEWHQERSLDAEAAREIQREFDASLSAFPLTPSTSRLDRAPSPLIPPAPPFANRAVSPGPIQGPPPGAAPPVLPYSQSYGSDNDQDNLEQPPPRLSFSGRSASSARFQSTPEPPASSYATPSEFPIPRPPLSPTGSTSSATPGARTISAAAFRRMKAPGPGSTDGPEGAGIAPLSVNKRPLPSSPYPVRRSSDAAAAAPSLPEFAPSSPLLSSQPDRTGSPTETDYGALGNMKVVNNAGVGAGYGSGMYNTNLQ